MECVSNLFISEYPPFPPYSPVLKTQHNPVIALVFTFYVLSFIIDLLPGVRIRHHIPQGERQQQEMSTTAVTYPSRLRDEVTVSYERPLTMDSMGDNGDAYRGQMVPSGVNPT